MRISTDFVSLAALLAASLTQAQFLINELSFGHSGRLSPDNNGKIPGFDTQGEPTGPQILSNKVILTPPSPGNARGAIWSDSRLMKTHWVTDVDFRATGPERGGGNFNIWLVRGGASAVGSASIYKVGRFDGLALVVDAHGGSGGMIRAFLNDGRTDYAGHHNIDELAFGQCTYSYRNLGRPSQLKVTQSPGSFKVEIDGKLCFETDKVRVPSGNYVGVTAATPDNPDSFELFKVTVMSGVGSPPSGQPQGGDTGNADANSYNNAAGSVPAEEGDGLIDEIPDEDADIFQTSKQQFQDLHNRLQSVSHQVNSVSRTVLRGNQQSTNQHTEMKSLVDELKGSLAKLDSIVELQTRIETLEKEVRGMRTEVSRKISANERSFKGYLSDHHATLSQTMLDSMPGHKRLILIFIGTQIVLVGAYVVYKRRRLVSPKKYL